MKCLTHQRIGLSASLVELVELVYCGPGEIAHFGASASICGDPVGMELGDGVSAELQEGGELEFCLDSEAPCGTLEDVELGELPSPCGPWDVSELCELESPVRSKSEISRGQFEIVEVREFESHCGCCEIAEKASSPRLRCPRRATMLLAG